MKIAGFSLFVLTFSSLLVAQQGLVASHAPTGVAKTAAASAASAPVSAVDLKKVALKVNGIGFSEADVREQMQRLFPYYSMHGGKVPEKYQGEIREKAIEQLTDDELMYQEAKRLGKRVSPVTLETVIRQAKQRFGSQAAYESFAISRYGSVQEFERRIRRATLIAQFQNSNIDQKARLSDVQVREVYEKNKQSFKRPESVWMQTITVALPDKASAEQRNLARTRIEEILPQARAVESSYEKFGLLAEKVSEDEYRVMMGDRKWVHLVGMPPEVTKAVAGLKKAQVSNIVESPSGFAIIRINDRRPEKQLEFSEVKGKLRQELESGKAKELAKELRARLRKGARVEAL